MTGRKEWYIPDGDLPEPTPGDRFISHEALMVLNPNYEEARLELTLYWEDAPPTRGITFTVPAERVRCVRLDRIEELGGPTIPFRTQYAIRITSNVGVFVQYGRLDTAQANYTLVGMMGAMEP